MGIFSEMICERCSKIRKSPDPVNTYLSLSLTELLHSRVTLTVVGTLLLLSVACGCKEGSVSAGENSAAQSQTRYTCPMHPQVFSEKKESCAICGMHLVPVTPDRAPPSAGQLADRTTVQVAPESAKLIGVRTTRVEKRPMVITVRSGAKAKIDPALFNLLQQYRESSTDLRATSAQNQLGMRLHHPPLTSSSSSLRQRGLRRRISKILTAIPFRQSLPNDECC